MHFVRDYDNGFSIVLHSSENGEELFGFLRSKNSRRLVQNEYIGASVKNFYNFYRLLFGNRHFMDFLFRVYRKTVFFGDCSNFLIYVTEFILAPVIYAENYIFACGEHINKFEMLMYHAYFIVKSVFRRFYNSFLSVHYYVTCVRIVNSGNHIHKGCFSAAVFSENGKYLPFVNRHINIFVGCYTAERFCNMT